MKYNITVIIPYKEDRGWLKEAIASVPKDVQLIVSQGDGNWPQNFNKALPRATGDYIKYLHEDDLIPGDSLRYAAEEIYETGVDFLHGNAWEFYGNSDTNNFYVPKIATPTFAQLMKHNVIHSATTMYRRDVFEKVGLFNEDPKMYSFEEYEFNLRCLKAGLKIGYLCLPLGKYRRHPKQIIRTVDKQMRNINREEMLRNMIV